MSLLYQQIFLGVPVSNQPHAFWMPFTDTKFFQKKPRLLSSAKGLYYFDSENRPIMDATSGLWCVNIGHGHPEVVEAIQQQTAKMSYCPPFQFGHEAAFSLAEKISALAPQGLNRVFFTNSGSESVETALKIALAYQKIRGKATKQRLIGRVKGYHGVGFGGISVGGIAANRKWYEPLLSGVDHLPHTYPETQRFVHGLPEENPHLSKPLEDIIELHGAESICAVIIEPISGSAGVILPPKNYLKKIREICTKHDILLIFDEVITAFGRLGKAFAAEHFGVTPDIICCAKGLTSGYVPMGAVVVRDSIHEAFQHHEGIELFHGYTYSAHPLAVAAAHATLDVYKKEQLFDKVEQITDYWQKSIHSLRGLAHIQDIRAYGLMAALDIEPSNKMGERAMAILNNAFFEQNLLIRVTKDTIALSPPFIVEKADIDSLVGKLKTAIGNCE